MTKPCFVLHLVLKSYRLFLFKRLPFIFYFWEWFRSVMLQMDRIKSRWNDYSPEWEREKGRKKRFLVWLYVDLPKKKKSTFENSYLQRFCFKFWYHGIPGWKFPVGPFSDRRAHIYPLLIGRQSPQSRTTYELYLQRGERTTLTDNDRLSAVSRFMQVR